MTEAQPEEKESGEEALRGRIQELEAALASAEEERERLRRFRATATARAWSYRGRNRALEKEIAALEEQSERNPKTGLQNRKAFDRIFDALADSLSHHNEGEERRAEGGPASLVVGFGDLNGLHTLNALLGHEVVDDLLRDVAQILLVAFRPTDLVAHFQGDEFAFLLPNLALDVAEERFALVAQEVRDCVLEYARPAWGALEAEHGSLPVALPDLGLGISFGAVAMLPGDRRTEKEVLDEADTIASARKPKIDRHILDPYMEKEKA